MTNWRRIATFAVASLCATVCGMTAAQAAWPEHTIRMIVGYPPGGGTDVLARLLAQKLSESIGQPVVVENKAGAGGIVGASYVAQAPADGYTIIMITSNHTVPLDTKEKLPYDPLKSFTPISAIAYLPSILVVNATLPVKTVKEFIDLAKTRPGKFNFGSTGPGTAQYMDMVLFGRAAGIDIVSVNYGGAAPILVALLGDEIQVTSQPITASLPQLQAGKVKALAISGKSRSPLLPEVPTFQEGGEPKGFVSTENWYGIVGPAGLPAPVVARLHDELVKAVKGPQMQDALAQQGFVTLASTAEAFAVTMSDDIVRWGSVISAVQGK